MVQASGAARRRSRLHHDNDANGDDNGDADDDDNDDNDDEPIEPKAGHVDGGTIEIDDDGESQWVPRHTVSDTEGSQGKLACLC